MHLETWFGDNSIFAPASNSKSALPELLVIALLPCFATYAPQDAAINEEAVDILNAVSYTHLRAHET